MKELFLSCLLLLFAVFSSPVSGHDFKIISHIGEKGPMPDDCLRMGVSTVWFYSGLPVKITEKGDIAWSNEDAGRKIKAVFKRFEDSGIEVIPLTNVFYEKFQTDGQISRFSDKPYYRCFSIPNGDIKARISFLVKELSKYKSFGGICIDDEPGIPPGGCVCENCITLFKKQYGITPPAVEGYLNAAKGIVSEDNPILLWQKFQEAQMHKYYTSISEMIKRDYPDCLVLNIPAAAYYSGKQLSIPNCKLGDFIKTGRRVSLDNCHIIDFQFYVQFYMNEITSSGWKNKIADGLCVSLMPNGLPNFPNIPIHDIYPDNSKTKTISVPAFRRFILQTFSEGAHGIVYFPGNNLSAEHINTAENVYKKLIQPICQNVPNLHKMKVKTAILYSNTTRTFADLWVSNPIERYKHLHECDALGYYLFKKGIPFEMLLEDEIWSNEDLKHFTTILSVGIDYLGEKSAKMLDEYIKNGGTFILDKKSAVNINGAQIVDFDAESWYRSVTGGNQHSSDMEFQSGILESALSGYFNNSMAICRSTSRHLNINYLTDGKDIYLFIVNDNLDAQASTELHFDKKYDILDILDKKDLGKMDNIQITIGPAELKVLKLNHKQIFQKN